MANTGARDGVSCFKITKDGLVALDTQRRPFNLGQSTPPTGPLNTVSRISFNEDSTLLITTVKTGPLPPAATTQFFSVFPVSSDGKVATTDVRTSPPGTLALFGFEVLPSEGQNRLLVTDAAFGYGIFTVDPVTAKVSTVVLTTVPGQNVTCWASYSAQTKAGYVFDLNKNTFVETDIHDGHIVQQFTPDNDNPGMSDSTVAGDFVYALSAAGGAVAVFDTRAGSGKAKAVQNFKVPGISARAQGLNHV